MTCNTQVAIELFQNVQKTQFCSPIAEESKLVKTQNPGLIVRFLESLSVMLQWL